ncbi:MAG: DUF2284 domain-containing protein [Actinomycetota bacterium]
MIWEKKFKARKVSTARPSKKDLSRYLEFALAAGADESRLIPARQVVVDERVRLKCMVPRCHLYASSPNCPPYTPDIGTMRKVIARYRWAVLVKNDVVPVEDFSDQKKWLKGHEKHQRKIHDIVGAVESRAYNDGYYFSTGFAAGGCKTALCSGLVCQFLDSGRCRFPLKARPSMEGAGIDAFRLAVRAGWDVYPVASRLSDPCSIKSAISMGIIFIG